MRRIAGERALPETRQSDYYRSHPGAGARLLVFEDHARKHGQDSPGISEADEALLARIAKIKAFTDAPMQTIGEIERARNTTRTDATSAHDWPHFRQIMIIYIGYPLPITAEAPFPAQWILLPN